MRKSSVRSDEVTESLANIVNRVLERLSEEGLPKTRLADEWEAIAKSGPDEREFCLTAAKLGLDPYSVPDEIAADIIDIATELPADLASDFFDSADPGALWAAARWTRRAVASAEKASTRASKSLRSLYDAVATDQEFIYNVAGKDDGERPWLIGHAMAKQVRSALSIGSTKQFDTSPWVGLGESTTSSSGIQGVVAVNNDRCGLILGFPKVGASINRFGQARALGRILLRPVQKQFVLSLARSNDERVAGAFAAELLAPADGIRQYLATIGKSDDSAIEAVADRYRVSPLLIRHQYDNQIANSADGFYL